MCLHTASSIVSLASAVKVLHSFFDWSSSGTYSAQLVQQCLSLSLGLQVGFERLMAELFVVAWAISVILEVSRLNHGSRSRDIISRSCHGVKIDQLTVCTCVVMALAPVHDNLSSTDEIDGDLVMGGIVVQGGSPGVNKDNLDQPGLFSHLFPEVFEGASVSNCRETFCV